MKLAFPRSRTARWLAAAGFSAVVGASMAQDVLSTEGLPEAQRFGQVSVISGGVDLGQAEAMRKAQSGYPLRVVFSVRSGDYAVPDEFRILKGDEVIVDLPSAGPWLLIDLPAGSYRMQTIFQGRATERTVRVGRGGQTVHWVAPSGVD